MARRRPAAHGDRRAAVAPACRPAGDPRGRSDRSTHRLVRAVRGRSAQAQRPQRSRARSAIGRGPPPAWRHLGSRQFDGGTAAVQRRTQLRPPAAPCADGAGRGCALYRRRQAGHDLLGLQRRRRSPRRVPGKPAGGATSRAGDSAGRSRLGPRRCRRRYTLGVVAVGSAGRAAAAHAGAARLAGAALPAPSRTLSRGRSARPCAEPCRAPAARAAADPRQHAAAGQRKSAARTRPPDRRAVTPRRRLRGRHRWPGRRDRGLRERPADRTRRSARHAGSRRRQRGGQGAPARTRARIKARAPTTRMSTRATSRDPIRKTSLPRT